MFIRLLFSVFIFSGMGSFLVAQMPYEILPIEVKSSKLPFSSVRVITGMAVSVEGRTYEEKALNYIESKWGDFGFSASPNDVLQHNQTKSFHSGVVVRYRQYFNGLRVDNNEYTLKFDGHDNICITMNSLSPVSDLINLNPVLSSSSAIEVVKTYLKTSGKINHSSSELMIHFIDGAPKLCHNVKISSVHPFGDWSAFIDAGNGDLLEINCMSQAINGTGRIFSPSPTFSAKAHYGDIGTNGSFSDNNDVSNIEIENQMMDVDLLDITQDANLMYVLKGSFAEIVDYGPPYDGLYEQVSTNFVFDREDEEFEAVMGYYHIDKSMRYVNNVLGVTVGPISSEGVKYDPHGEGNINNAHFNSFDEVLTFGDGDHEVDTAEDAFFILHELAHGLHYWLTNTNSFPDLDGLAEGLSDYWGQSNTRECSEYGIWTESNQEFFNVFHWGGMPTVAGQQRITNYDTPYSKPLSPYQGAQHISTTLMDIRKVIGKFKSDLLVIESMPMLVSGVDLPTAAKLIYQTAILLGFSENELCVIYNIFEGRFSISQPPINIPSPSGGYGDLFMRDSDCDRGDQPNFTSEEMYISTDIWVRNYPDGGSVHQNPEYKGTPNYIYVNVRGLGCSDVTDANLRVYFSKASTQLQWPVKWDNYFIPGPNGLVLAGDEITKQPLSNPIGVLPIDAGGIHRIGPIPWMVPNPTDYYSDIHHFCLLARIESGVDPMYAVEGIPIEPNIRNNNNIVLKNISIFDENPLDNLLGPISVFIGCDSATLNGSFQIESARMPLGKTIFDYGEISIDIDEPLRSKWFPGGLVGSGIQVLPDSTIVVLNETFSLEGVPITNCDSSLINVYFEPFIGARDCGFSLVQYDSLGVAVGGERFEYVADSSSTIRELFSSEIEVDDLSTTIKLFPNPSIDHIWISSRNVFLSTSDVLIFDIFGNVVINLKAIDESGVDVSDLNSGVYFLQVTERNAGIIYSNKFIKL